MNNYPRAALFQGVPPNAVMVISTLTSSVPLLEEMRKVLRGRWWTRLVVERNLDGMLVWWVVDFVSNFQKKVFLETIEDKIGRWHELGREVGLGSWFRSRREDLLETIGGENNLNDCSMFLDKKTRLISSTFPCLRQPSFMSFTLKVVVQKPMEMRSLVLVTQQRGWVISSFSKTHLMIARKVENDDFPFWDTNCTSHKNREEIQKCIVMAKNWKAIGANIKRAHLKSA